MYNPIRFFTLCSLSLLLWGCTEEEPAEPCSVNCGALEYCGQSACDACPSFCNDPDLSPEEDGGSAAPPTTDAGAMAPDPEDAGSTHPAPSDGGTTSPTHADAGTTLDCTAVDSIQKAWGGTSGPCGPHYTITVNSDGSVEQSEESAYPPDGATECAAPIITQYTATASDAAGLIALICNDYNANHIPIAEGCVGAYENYKLAQGETTLATADTSCGNNTMSASKTALDEFMASLIEPADAGQSTQEVDSGTANTDGGLSDALDCTQVDSIIKTWGGTSGPCGPRYSITLNSNGSVETSDEAAYPPEGASTCADPVVAQYTAAISDVLALMATICDDYNNNHVPNAGGCVGAYKRYRFYQGTSELAEADLSCGNNFMTISNEAIDAFVEALEAEANTMDGGQ